MCQVGGIQGDLSSSILVDINFYLFRTKEIHWATPGDKWI